MPTQQLVAVQEHERLLHSVGSWLLVFAHPGHELRAHHLLERVRPSVFVLTDGSGSTSTPRLDDSRALISQAGARINSTFGVLTDREAYAALMAIDEQPFAAQVATLADTILTQNVQAVVVDAAEGYNPVHDVCHWIARAASMQARRRGASLTLFEVDLIAHPDAPGAGLRLELDDAAFARKLEATSRYGALRVEAEQAFARYGQDAFRTEFLRVISGEELRAPSWVPYYEEVGNARVREGRYTSVLRYATHVRPVIARLLGPARAHHATALDTLHQ